MRIIDRSIRGALAAIARDDARGLGHSPAPVGIQIRPIIWGRDVVLIAPSWIGGRRGNGQRKVAYRRLQPYPPLGNLSAAPLADVSPRASKSQRNRQTTRETESDRAACTTILTNPTRLLAV